MAKQAVIIGQKYGMLTVVREEGLHTFPSGQKLRQYLCKCECGGKKIIVGSKIKRGAEGKTGGVKSCGCLKKDPIGPPKNGQMFDRLTVIEEVEPEIWGKAKRRLFKCRCECGAITVTRMTSLNNGRTRSCGCLQSDINTERATTHGMSRSNFYGVWHHMIERTTETNHPSWHNYGGRGIKVCDRWRHSFKNFRDDMFPSYKEGLQIDRRDNDGNYSPENCRWVTAKENARNKRDNHKYEGKLVVEWAEELGIKYSTLSSRIRRNGYASAIEYFSNKK